jgi:hypothetical protein
MELRGFQRVKQNAFKKIRNKVPARTLLFFYDRRYKLVMVTSIRAMKAFGKRRSCFSFSKLKGE